jgi:hypothetical protein
MLRSRYEIVKNINKEFLYKDWGIKVTNGTIYFDKYRDKLILQLNVQNISSKNIKEVNLNIRCIDESGRTLPEEVNYSYSFINIKPGNSFGEDDSIPLKSKKVKNIEISLEKIEFDDLSFIKYSNNKAIEFDTYSNTWNKTNTEKIDDLNFSLKQPNKYVDSNVENNAPVNTYNAKNKSTNTKKKYNNQNKTEHIKSKDNYDPYKQNNMKNKSQILSIDQQDAQKVLASEKRKTDKIRNSGLSTKEKIKLAKNKYKIPRKSDNPQSDKETSSKDNQKKSSALGIVIAIIFFLISIFDFGSGSGSEDSLTTLEDYYYSMDSMVESLNSEYNDVKQIATSKYDFTNSDSYLTQVVYMLKNDGTVGYTISDENDEYVFNDILDWNNIKSISSKSSHIVGLTNDGTAVASGYNNYSECDLYDWNNLVDVKAGDGNTIGLKSDGTVLMAGRLLDEDNYVNYHYNKNDWVDISSIYTLADSVFGLKNDGTVVSAGENFDYIDVSGWTDIEKLYTDSDYGIIGLKKDKTLVSQGHDIYNENSISDWSDIADVYSTETSIVATKSDGTVLVKGFTLPYDDDIDIWSDIKKSTTGKIDPEYASDNVMGNQYVIGVKQDGSVSTASYLEDKSLFSDLENWHNIIDIYLLDGCVVGLNSEGNVFAQNLMIY